MYITEDVVFQKEDDRFYHLCRGKDYYGKRTENGKCNICGKEMKENVKMVMRLVGEDR